MKSAGLVVAALFIAAVGFLGGWVARGDLNPTVTVQMAPAERAYFMPPIAQISAGSPCRITGELKQAGKPVTAEQQKRCDDDIAADLAKAMELSIPRKHR